MAKLSASAFCKNGTTRVYYWGLETYNEEKKPKADLINSLGDSCKDRLQVIHLDTSSDESVQKAAESISGDDRLYGIINNAGIGFGRSMEETVNTNYFGPRRVNDAFGKHLKRPGGRIVNVSSASGPIFLQNLSDANLKGKLNQAWTIPGGLEELDTIARTIKGGNEYGASKALLNAYTFLYAKANKDLIINAITPGYIKTDLTAGSGASNPPSKGAVPPCWLMMDEDVAHQPTGRYYGSDCVRSPMDCYRGPGEEPYVNNDDLVEVSKN